MACDSPIGDLRKAGALRDISLLVATPTCSGRAEVNRSCVVLLVVWLVRAARAHVRSRFTAYIQYRATVLESRLFAITLRIGPIAVMFMFMFIGGQGLGTRLFSFLLSPGFAGRAPLR